jgi:hypothetical protein
MAEGQNIRTNPTITEAALGYALELRIKQRLGLGRKWLPILAFKHLNPFHSGAASNHEPIPKASIVVPKRTHRPAPFGSLRCLKLGLGVEPASYRQRES